MGDDRLCAVVCVPESGGEDLGVVLLTGGNYTRTHRNSMWVRTARALAERGYPSIRVDYHGVGDSTGRARFELEAPFGEDAEAAARFLQRAVGVPKVALVATCFGGRSAMAAAARHPDVISATIFPVPLLIPSEPGAVPVRSKILRWMRRWGWVGRFLRRPAVRKARSKAAARRERPSEIVSPRFKRDLAAFLERGDVRFVYGEHTLELRDLRSCLAEIDGHIGTGRRDRIRVDIVPGTDLNRFQSLEDQEIVVSRSVASVDEAFRSLAGASGRA
ncbi:MAG: alpha/beta fold hydrolase [Actinomycetota bacterium]